MVDGWIENRGTMPRMLEGQRINVRFRNGMMPRETYPADGKQGVRWSLTEKHPFDITHWKPA